MSLIFEKPSPEAVREEQFRNLFVAWSSLKADAMADQNALRAYQEQLQEQFRVMQEEKALRAQSRGPLVEKLHAVVMNLVAEGLGETLPFTVDASPDQLLEETSLLLD
jgi:hypothetical protein